MHHADKLQSVLRRIGPHAQSERDPICRRGHRICVTESTDNRNYYEVLHVDRDAPMEVIRGSYRRLMQQRGHHPDLGGDTAIAATINKAYAVLTDPGRRTEYDARLDDALRVAQSFVDEADVQSAATQASRVLDPARECVFCEMPHGLGTIIEADAKCENCDSPLCAAENLRIELADKRAVARIQKRLDVRFFTDWRQTEAFAGRTEDISLNGLRLVTKRGIRKRQRIKLVSSVVEAVGNITHCVPRRAGWKTEHVAGVSFVTLRFVKSVGGFLSRLV